MGCPLGKFHCNDASFVESTPTGARVGNFHFRFVGDPLSGGAISTRSAGSGVGTPVIVLQS